MSNDYNTLSVGMNGTFKAISPFNTVVNGALNYTVIAIEDITGLLARGKDPFTEVYAPYGLNRARFDSDDIANIPIFTLQSNQGGIIMLPGNCITGMPDVNGVKYSNVIIGVSLSAIPDTLDLSSLKTEMSDLAFNRLGIRSEVKSIVFGTPNIVNNQDHMVVEAARISNVSNVKSNLTLVNEYRIQNAALVRQVATLEAYIKDKQI